MPSEKGTSFKFVERSDRRARRRDTKVGKFWRQSQEVHRDFKGLWRKHLSAAGLPSRTEITTQGGLSTSNCFMCWKTKAGKPCPATTPCRTRALWNRMPQVHTRMPWPVWMPSGRALLVVFRIFTARFKVATSLLAGTEPAKSTLPKIKCAMGTACVSSTLSEACSCHIHGCNCQNWKS